MKVSEIIEKMQRLDPNTDIIIDAMCIWDCGYCCYDHTYNNWLSDKHWKEDKKNNVVCINLFMDADERGEYD